VVWNLSCDFDIWFCVLPFIQLTSWSCWYYDFVILDGISWSEYDVPKRQYETIMFDDSEVCTAVVKAGGKIEWAVTCLTSYPTSIIVWSLSLLELIFYVTALLVSWYRTSLCILYIYGINQV
jgi:hypothetical protein